MDRFTLRREKRGPGGVYIPLLVLILLAAGALLRAAGDKPVIFTTLIYAPARRVEYPGTRTPEDTVKSFYLSVDSGEYGKAYEVVLEPDWSSEKGPAPFREGVEAREGPVPGWTSENEFLERLEHELGSGGSGITLSNVEARVLEEIDPGPYQDIRDLQGAFKVEASGNILGACAIFTWKKELIVLKVGKRYRLLLTGTKMKNNYYYQSWFSDFKQAGALRGHR